MSAAADWTHAALAECSESYRLSCAGIKIDGGMALDFRRYPFVCEIIDRHAPRMTIIKGAQLGISIAMVLKSLGDARRGGLRGILYGFPSDREVQDFSKARFAPLMAKNPGQWNAIDSTDTDSAGLKQIGDVFIYFRGIGQKGGASTKSLSAIKSIPVDRAVFDERDEMDDSRFEEAKHRLDGSLSPELTCLSTPTLPGYGVDLDYVSSNQSAWLWKCTACSAWTCLEDTYPDCIATSRDRDPYYLCSGCRGPLERTKGEWVARKPDVRDHIGYWVSQLCSPTKTAGDILQAADDAVRRGHLRAFHNQTLGRAYAEVDEEITRQQLEALLTDTPKPLRHEGPCAMGVDPGKPHWYTVRVRTSDVDSLCIARGRADTYEELHRIAQQYNVQSGVMDQGYDPSAVASFVEAHAGWYGGLYVGGKRSSADWDHRERMVKMGRTRTLDDAHRAIIAKRVTHVQRDEFWDKYFVPQMTNLKRATLEKDRTGEREGVWVVTGGQKNDHLRHADAYCHLATERVGLSKSVARMRARVEEQDSWSDRPLNAATL